jgi:hypothetical protein
MGFTETIVIYLLIGAVVAAAHSLSSARGGFVKSALSFAAAVPFWPIYAPFLMARGKPATGPRLDGRISVVEARLIEALRSLGLAEELLAPELERVRGLGRALETMSKRAAEMSALLATPEFSRERAERTLAELEDADPRATSIRARMTNIDRLETMRQRTLTALERAMLEAEEIGSRMALLRFAERPDEEVVRMIREIAASVEGVAEGLAL